MYSGGAGAAAAAAADAAAGRARGADHRRNVRSNRYETTAIETRTKDRKQDSPIDTRKQDCPVVLADGTV